MAATIEARIVAAEDTGSDKGSVSGSVRGSKRLTIKFPPSLSDICSFDILFRVLDDRIFEVRWDSNDPSGMVYRRFEKISDRTFSVDLSNDEFGLFPVGSKPRTVYRRYVGRMFVGLANENCGKCDIVALGQLVSSIGSFWKKSSSGSFGDGTGERSSRVSSVSPASSVSREELEEAIAYLEKSGWSVFRTCHDGFYLFGSVIVLAEDLVRYAAKTRSASRSDF